MTPPDEQVLSISTERLRLEPISTSHAVEMAALLSDPLLHRYIPSTPPSVDELRARYERWEARRSPSGDELWLNWVARCREDGVAIGHFQAGLDERRHASIAYVVGASHQRRGYALEAMAAVCLLLTRTLQAERVRAWIDTRNEASIALARRLGMREVERISGADVFKGAVSDEVVFELPKEWSAPR